MVRFDPSLNFLRSHFVCTNGRKVATLFVTQNVPNNRFSFLTVPGDRVSASEIVAELSNAVAKAVGKPESYVLVSLTTDKAMSYVS